jgi:hypothetical protein
MALAVALVLVAAGAVAVWQATHGGCSADRLPDRIGVYTRTDTELTSVDPMPEQSGVRPSLPETVLELPSDGTCPALPAGSQTPMRIWLKVNPSRFVMYVRPGGP